MPQNKPQIRNPISGLMVPAQSCFGCDRYFAATHIHWSTRLGGYIDSVFCPDCSTDGTAHKILGKSKS